MLRLDSGEVAANGADRELGRRRRVGTVEAKEEVKVIVAEAVEKAGIPTEVSRGEGVTDVVVAVTKGTLTVLPGLALEDEGESEEKDGAVVIGEEGIEVEMGAELDGVVFGGSSGRGKRRRKRGSHRRGEAAKGGGLRWGGGCLGLTRRD